MERDALGFLTQSRFADNPLVASVAAKAILRVPSLTVAVQTTPKRVPKDPAVTSQNLLRTHEKLVSNRKLLKLPVHRCCTNNAKEGLRCKCDGLLELEM